MTLYIERISPNPGFISGLDSIGYIVDIDKGDQILFSSIQYRIKISDFNWIIQMPRDSFVEILLSRKAKHVIQKKLIPPPQFCSHLSCFVLLPSLLPPPSFPSQQMSLPCSQVLKLETFKSCLMACFALPYTHSH